MIKLKKKVREIISLTVSVATVIFAFFSLDFFAETRSLQ